MNNDSMLVLIGLPIAAVLLVSVVIPILLRPLNRKVDRAEYKLRARVRDKLSGSQRGAPDSPPPAPAGGAASAAPAMQVQASGGRSSGSKTGRALGQVSVRAVVAVLVLAVLFIYLTGSLALTLVGLVVVGIGIHIVRDLNGAKKTAPAQGTQKAMAVAAPAPMGGPATPASSSPSPAADSQEPTPGASVPVLMQVERVELGAEDTLVDSLGIDIVGANVPVAGPAQTGEEFVSAIVAMEGITLRPDHADDSGAISAQAGTLTFTQHRLFGVVWGVEGAHATTFSPEAGAGSTLAFSAPREAFTSSQFGRMRGGFTGAATYESMAIVGASSVTGEPLTLFNLDAGAFDRTAHGGVRLVAEAFVEGLRMPDHDTVRKQL